MRRRSGARCSSVSDKTGLDRARGGRSHELGVELVSSGSTAAAIAAAGVPVTRVATSPGSPEMLDHRVKTLHPKIHGGLLADLGNESHLADLETPRHRAVRARRVEPVPVPRAARDRDDRHRRTRDDARASAKNHAWVTIVTELDQYGALLDELRANDGTVSEETRRAFALEAFARTAAYDAAIVQWLQADEELPAALVLALERTEETLRYGENPHQQAARYRRARRHELVGRRAAARRARALVPQLLRHRRGVAARARSRERSRVRDHQAREPVRSRARDRTRRRVPTRARVRRTVGVRRHRRAATGRSTPRRSRAMVEGPQADVVIAPGYAAGCDRGAARQAQEHADPRSRPRRVERRSTSARSPAGSSSRRRTTSRRRARVAGRHQGRADAPSSGAISSSRGASAVT